MSCLIPLRICGYEVDLQYASNDVSTQVSQLENQVANGCDLLVVASIDGSSLGEPLKQAKEAGIPVISYDRLLMNSDAVTYYATLILMLSCSLRNAAAGLSRPAAAFLPISYQ